MSDLLNIPSNELHEILGDLYRNYDDANDGDLRRLYRDDIEDILAELRRRANA